MRLHYGRLLAALIGLALALPGGALAATNTLTFSSGSDTYVNASVPGPAHAASSTLRVSADPATRAYLQFRVSGIAGRVSQATLRVYARTASRVGYSVRAADAGARRPAPFAVGTRVASSGPFRRGSWTTVDVAKLVQGNGTVRLALTSSDRGPIALSSRESVRKPQLVVRTTAVVSSSTALENGTVRVAVDLAKGGTITYFGGAGGGENLVNSYDLGREIQPSYRSGPYDPADPRYSWNPTAAGDKNRQPSQVLAYSNDGQTLYVKSVPNLWFENGVPCECQLEQWITLDGNAFWVRNRFTNARSDSTQYRASGQEVPAIFTNSTLDRVVTYDGTEPFTNGPLRTFTAPVSTHTAPLDPAPFVASEHWAAMVDDSGHGLGLYEPDVSSFRAWGFRAISPSAAADVNTGYLAANVSDILDAKMVYDHSYAIVLGTPDDVRAYAVAHRSLNSTPDFRFQSDRQHWRYINATDTGMPHGALTVNLTQTASRLLSPEMLWPTGFRTVYIRAAYRPFIKASAAIAWRGPGQPDFTNDRRLVFPLIPDGLYHTYPVDLFRTKPMQPVTQLRLEPWIGTPPGTTVDIAYIATAPLPEIDALTP